MGSQIYLGRWGPTPWEAGLDDPLKHATPHVSLPNFVAVGQAVSVLVGVQKIM